MTLPEDIYQKIKAYSQAGEVFFQKSDFQNAILNYKNAIDLLPNPKEKWDAATWLYTAIGDSFYLLKNYLKALNNFTQALNSANGKDNPFINLRLGQCYYEIKNFEEVDNFFLRAYLLDDERIFKGEPTKYLSYLKKKYDL